MDDWMIMNGRTELPTASPAHTPAGERYSPRKNEPSEGTPEQQPAQLHQPKRVPRLAASLQWPNPIPQVPGASRNTANARPPASAEKQLCQGMLVAVASSTTTASI